MPLPGRDLGNEQLPLADAAIQALTAQHADMFSQLACLHEHLPGVPAQQGLSYGVTYAGPIGIVIAPTFNARKYSKLPFSSTLNGSCTNVCPVKINIHGQIADWRRVMSETHELPVLKKAAGVLLSSPKLYRAALPLADSALRHLPRFVVYNRLNTWARGREMPPTPRQTFHQWHREHRGAKKGSNP